MVPMASSRTAGITLKASGGEGRCPSQMLLVFLVVLWKPCQFFWMLPSSYALSGRLLWPGALRRSRSAARLEAALALRTDAAVEVLEILVLHILQFITKKNSTAVT